MNSMKHKKQIFIISFLLLLTLNKLVFPSVYLRLVKINNISYILTTIGSLLLILVSQYLVRFISFHKESRKYNKIFIWQGLIEVLLLIIVISITSDIIIRAKLAQNTDFYFEGFIVQHNIVDQIICLLVLGVFPAFAEELYFRQTFYNFFEPKKHIYLFIFLSGIFFALFHSDLLSKISAFILGMILMQIYLLCKNIKITIILHILFNWCMILISFFRPIVYRNILLEIDRQTKTDYIVSVLLELGVLNLILAAFFSLYIKFINRNIFCSINKK